MKKQLIDIVKAASPERYGLYFGSNMVCLLQIDADNKRCSVITAKATGRNPAAKCTVLFNNSVTVFKTFYNSENIETAFLNFFNTHLSSQ